MQLITQDLKRDDFILAGVAAAVVALLQWKWRISTAPKDSKRPWRKLLITLSGYLLLLHFLPYTYDEIASFGQSARKTAMRPSFSRAMIIRASTIPGGF